MNDSNPVATPPLEIPEAAGQWHIAWNQLRRKKMAMGCLGILIIYTVLWLLAEGQYWAPRLKKVPTVPEYKVDRYEAKNLPPGRHHLLGTNFAGRDNFLQVLQGARIAFELAIITSLLAIPIGFFLGAVAGYFGRKVDTAVVYLFTIVDSIPNILLILALVYVVRGLIDRSEALQVLTNNYVDSGLLALSIGMGLTSWIGLCRLIRAEYMKHRERQYVLAARSLGATHFSIMFRHIMPNVFHLVIINFSLRFSGLILTEVVLGYLGLGVASEPSWGNIINDAKQRLWLGNWWELAGATAAIFFLVLALNIFGDALRDALDPKLRTAEARTG